LNWVNKTDLYIASGLTLSQTNTIYGKTPLIINQKDVNKAFIAYDGHFNNTSPKLGNLTTYQASGSTILSVFAPNASDYGWQWEGMLKMNLAEFGLSETPDKFIAFYSWYFSEEEEE